MIYLIYINIIINYSYLLLNRMHKLDLSIGNIWLGIIKAEQIDYLN